ncbi:MAG: hypothetical protein LIP01_15780 [Tannerellaceae bacterium]|nr:hypothetical protein [Tannerellaceae bacterium]
MKRRNFLLSAIAMGVTAATAKTNLFNSNEKVLIVYYSWSGNTRAIANHIQTLTQGDIHEIIPEKAYPKDYNETVAQARKEIDANVRPVLKSRIENLDEYDVIFIGTPNWWSTIAPPIATFLSENNLSGKKVVPFCTHAGGGKAKCFTDTARLCPNATIADGFVVSGSNATSAKEQVEKWLQKI